MKRRYATSTVVALGVVLLAASPAFAGDPVDVSGTTDAVPEIFMGSPTGECDWPTVVAVSGGGLCTGTLIHPQLVVYAAHCGGGNKSLRFNSVNSTSGFTRSGTCQTNPAYSGVSNDWAFCVLSSPVNMPVTPAMHGCEMLGLEVGSPVALVGFGGSDTGGAGTKRWAMTSLTGYNLAGNASRVGASNTAPTICPGDSGGPAMKQFPDGSWHAFGIASILLGSCGGVGDHSLITGAIPWIEMTSGIDVTPCFDADGTWNPGPSCTGFSTVGPNGVGTWNNECSGQPSSGPSSSCGPSYGSTPETDPPTVDITAPQDQAMFASGELIDFAIDANDGTGWGVQRVTLEIDGQVQGDLDPKAWDGLAPWGFDGTFFNDGTFEIRALAEDGWGNTAFSDPITIYVGDAGTSGGTTSGTTSTSTSDGGASDTTGGGGTTSGESDTGCTSCTTGMDDADTADDGASLGGGDEGCACNTSGGSAPMRWFALLFTIPALGISRRRRRSSR